MAKKNVTQKTTAIPIKVWNRMLKVLNRSPYTTKNGFVVAAVIKEVVRYEKRKR